MVSKLKTVGQMRLLDMHAHLSYFMVRNDTDFITCGRYSKEVPNQAQKTLAERELEFRRNSGIVTFLNSGTPEEWRFLRQYQERDEIFLSFGIHPWHADKYEIPDSAVFQRSTEAYLRCNAVHAFPEAWHTCDAVGEIGIDNVWCDVPLSVQRRCFARQLEIAAQLKKPVFLHTKGMEAEIAAMIRDFPEPVCVHWYSGSIQSFEAFLEKGCYFTLGPDLAQICRPHAGGADSTAAELYGMMLREVPVDRLFVETDGISSIAWMRGMKEEALAQIPNVLKENMGCLAAAKNIQREELCGRMWENLTRFFGGTGGEQERASAGRA